MKPVLSYVSRSLRLGRQQHRRLRQSSRLSDLSINPPNNTTGFSLSCVVLKQPRCLDLTRRYFQTEGEYYKVADETLETIQDTVERALENAGVEAEIALASGVLTIVLPPPHGTYVINKQTPNRQLWWSSPISGPRRYEYNPETKLWVYTRDGEIGLGESLKEELQQLLDVELELAV